MSILEKLKKFRKKYGKENKEQEEISEKTGFTDGNETAKKLNLKREQSRAAVISAAAAVIIFLVLTLSGTVSIGKTVLSKDDFYKKVHTGLTTTAVTFDVTENGTEKQSDKTVYKYLLTASNDETVSFEVESETEYEEATVSGTKNTYEISYEDHTPYTMTYYATELGNSISDEELENFDYEEQLESYYSKYFKEK